MEWLIQDSIRNEPRYEDFISSLNKFDQKWYSIKTIPFIGEIQDEPLLDTNAVICFGSYSLRYAAAKRGWLPGIYDISWFPYQSLIDTLGEEVLNYDVKVGTFGSLVPNTDRFFIRPTHDDKQFAGTVMNRAELIERQHLVNSLDSNADKYLSGLLTTDTEVMCSSVKEIFDEYRYFVVGDKVVTGSRYKLGSRVVYGDTDGNISTAQSFADKLAKKIDHPYVLDIALTGDGYKVVELNTMNCAGFYLCDVQRLIMALIDFNESVSL